VTFCNMLLLSAKLDIVMAERNSTKEQSWICLKVDVTHWMEAELVLFPPESALNICNTVRRRF
jgi:hypothetical protein